MRRGISGGGNKVIGHRLVEGVVKGQGPGRSSGAQGHLDHIVTALG